THSHRMIQRRTSRQLAIARRLRSEMTAAEVLLWRQLRNRGTGPKFRRQVPIDRYVADFACVAAKLIIELDGRPHDDPEQQEHDRNRDAWLRAHGWHVLRFPNEQIISESPAVYAEINRMIELRTKGEPPLKP